jgi:hypothetical protein
MKRSKEFQPHHIRCQLSFSAATRAQLIVSLVSYPSALGAVNQVNIHVFVETMPFGGVGSAGMGHYYGKYGFDMLTHAKSIVSPPDVAIEHLFPPYSPKKNAATDNRRKWSW